MQDLHDEPRRTPEVEVGPVSGNGGHSDEHAADWGTIRPPSRLSMIVLLIIVVVALAALFATGYIPRVHLNQQLNADAGAAASAPVLVNVVRPEQAPADIKIIVPGSMRPWQEVSIFARTTGYLKKWYADISNEVKQGDLLAEIDTPEVDAQLGQARGSLAQMEGALAKTQSDVQIAKVTNERFQALKGTSGVTQQDLDQRQADYNSSLANLQAAQANVVSAQANVKRLTDLQSYEKVWAPSAAS